MKKIVSNLSVMIFVIGCAIMGKRSIGGTLVDLPIFLDN